MLRYPRSLWLAASLVLAIHAGVLLIGRGGAIPETKFPDRPLEEIPLQFSAWEGRTVEPDAQIFRRLGAQSVVNRAYRDPWGHEVILHVAMWSSDGLQLPHEPHICYAAAGYEILATRDFSLGEGDPAQATAHLMSLQRGSEQGYALYWYQWGAWTVADRHDLRQAMWRMRGQRPWPPLVKVLLHVTRAKADKAEKTEEHLRSLAQPLVGWLREYR